MNTISTTEIGTPALGIPSSFLGKLRLVLGGRDTGRPMWNDIRSRTTKTKRDKHASPNEIYERDRALFPFPRFWRLVDRRGSNECWRWLDRYNADGYGLFRPTLCGTDRAPKIVLIIKLKRDILDGLETLHSCDHKWCCNPSHLSEGTHLKNCNDAKARGLYAMRDARKSEAIR